MPDLNELKEMVDKALAAETPQSLTQWILETRLRTMLFAEMDFFEIIDSGPDDMDAAEEKNDPGLPT